MQAATVLALLGVVARVRAATAIRMDTTDLSDICIRESFEATCGQNEVVLIQEARYGRMRAGRCISQEYGHIGCANDVTSYLDHLCSGRHDCKTNVRILMDISQPCPKDFTSYLEASYSCLEVATGEREQCHRDNYVTVTSQEGNLASIITEETGYGSAGCPWKIKVLPGQRVNLTMFDFNRPWPFSNTPTLTREDPVSGCPISVVIDDQDKTRHIQLCETGDRMRHLYISSSNEISLHFSIRTMSKKHYYVMLQYKAVSCPRLDIPKKAWLRRDGDNARVECNTTGEVWYLTCRDGHWIGDLGNCTGSSSPSSNWKERGVFPFGLVLAVIIGIVLGVVIGACLLGIVFLCRRGYRTRSRDERDAILRGGRGLPPPEALYSETTTEGSTRTTVYPAAGRDPRAPRGDYAYKHSVETNVRNSLLEQRIEDQTRKPSSDFAYVPDENNRNSSCLRNHVYESPKFSRGTGARRQGEAPPLYHELDPDGDERCARHTEM